MVAEQAPVHAEMSATSEVLSSLTKGNSVTVYFAVQSAQGSWCKVAVKSEWQNFGYVRCSQLHRGGDPATRATTSAGGGDPSPECRALVDELIVATGLKSDFSLFSRDIYPAVTTNAFHGLDSKTRAEVIAIMQREFHPSVLEAGVRRGLLGRCDPANYAASLEVLRSPLVARMIKLEMAFNSRAVGNDRKSRAAAFREHPATQQRMALLQHLDDATGSSDFLIDLTVSAITSLASSIAGEGVPQAQLDDLRAKLTAAAKQGSLGTFYVAYQSATDDELRQYTAVWETPPIQQLNDAIKAVFQDVMAAQSAAAGADVKAYAESRRARSVTR